MKKLKYKTREVSNAEHRRDIELEAIIEDLGTAVRNANRDFIALTNGGHDGYTGRETFHFTVNMDLALCRFIEHCQKYPYAPR